MWRRQPHDLEMLGPYKITQFWSQLKDGVNAAYEDPGTNTITFFKGKVIRMRAIVKRFLSRESIESFVVSVSHSDAEFNI